MQGCAACPQIKKGRETAGSTTGSVFNSYLTRIFILAGCGKKMPECGDPQVQSIIEKIIKEANDGETLSKVGPLVAEIANSNFGGKKFWSVASVSSSISQKLDGFSTTNKDKDAGMAYCQAINSGYLTYEVKLTAEEYVKALGSLRTAISGQAVTDEDVKGALKGIFENEDSKQILSITVDAIETKLGSKDIAKFDGNILTVSVKKPLPKSVAYTANYSDKGDQILVTVTGNQ